MNKRTETGNASLEVRLLNADQLRTFLGLGKNNSVIFARECGAERHFGRRCLYDKKVLEAALDRLTD